MISVVVAFGIWYLRVRPKVIWAALAALAGIIALVLLRILDAKFFGVVIMGGAVMILFVLPWLDFSPVKSIRYRPGWHKILYLIFVVDFIVLGYIGTQEPNATLNAISQVGTLYYFTFFLAMPIWSQMGEFKPVPDRVVFHAH
jgi:ubiquinol-cytochrome c reductase cytochrome b subunit